MWKWLVLLFCSVAIADDCTLVKGAMYCSDGKSYVRTGSTAYGSDGSTNTLVGGTLYQSGGVAAGSTKMPVAQIDLSPAVGLMQARTNLLIDQMNRAQDRALREKEMQNTVDYQNKSLGLQGAQLEQAGKFHTEDLSEHGLDRSQAAELARAQMALTQSEGRETRAQQAAQFDKSYGLQARGVNLQERGDKRETLRDPEVAAMMGDVPKTPDGKTDPVFDARLTAARTQTAHATNSIARQDVSEEQSFQDAQKKLQAEHADKVSGLVGSSVDAFLNSHPELTDAPERSFLQPSLQYANVVVPRTEMQAKEAAAKAQGAAAPDVRTATSDRLKETFANYARNQDVFNTYKAHGLVPATANSIADLNDQQKAEYAKTLVGHLVHMVGAADDKGVYTGTVNHDRLTALAQAMEGTADPNDIYKPNLRKYGDTGLGKTLDWVSAPLTNPTPWSK